MANIENSVCKYCESTEIKVIVEKQGREQYFCENCGGIFTINKRRTEMIKEERLKELTEKEATIYLEEGLFIQLNKKNYNVGMFGLTHIDKIKKEWTTYPLENFYETKAEAEFVAEFGNVEKVVKMPVPPTWEEFKQKNEYRNCRCYLCHVIGFEKEMLDLDYGKYMFEFTEQGYISALRKIVELFKEEV